MGGQSGQGGPASQSGHGVKCKTGETYGILFQLAVLVLCMILQLHFVDTIITNGFYSMITQKNQKRFHMVYVFDIFDVLVVHNWLSCRTPTNPTTWTTQLGQMHWPVKAWNQNPHRCRQGAMVWHQH